MPYRPSSLDQKLAKRFASDMAHANLHAIELRKGVMRGLKQVALKIEFPITVIAGKNGCGKSTLLALAACAFHNSENDFPHKSRRNAYYTFADFFIQSRHDVPPDGVEIWYRIAYDKWHAPGEPRLGWQARRKRRGGKWNNYDARVDRNVVFLGIDRIVPHTEKGPSRSYSRRFSEGVQRGWETSVCDAVGYVLGRKYANLMFTSHSVPCVSSLRDS